MLSVAVKIAVTIRVLFSYCLLSGISLEYGRALKKWQNNGWVAYIAVSLWMKHDRLDSRALLDGSVAGLLHLGEKWGVNHWLSYNAQTLAGSQSAVPRYKCIYLVF